MPEQTELRELLQAAAAGRPRALGRLLSLVENPGPMLPTLMAEVAGASGRARVIGLTGAPGVGKSTTITALVAALRRLGQRVAVLAVDPSSPFSGGALLGDRVRMQQHAVDAGVFIRSMATRGHLGGLATAAPQAIRVLAAAGFETVLVETVGVGQSEVEVAGQVDLTLVLLAPGMGDGVQAAKAGVLEIGDIFVVNKADREGSHAVVRELRNMIALGQRRPGAWRPPVLTTSAIDETGIAELLAAIDACHAQLAANGELTRRWHNRARQEIETLVLARLRANLPNHGPAGLDELATAVADGQLDPYAAAEQVLRQTVGPAAGASTLTSA